MKKRKTVYLLGIPIVLVIGWFAGWLSNKNVWLSYSPEIKYGTWDIVYYVAAIFTSIGTLGAVFVALFKEKIMRLLNRPKIQLSMKDEKCYEEEVDTEQQNPVASRYIGFLEVVNKGNVTATGCEICIESVQYSKSRDKKMKEISEMESKRKLYWDAAKVDIPVDIPKQVWLFKIDQPNAYGTPSASGVNHTSQSHLQINGLKLKDNKSEKGIWEITYYIRNNEVDHSRFKLTIEWTGEWKTRKTEMIDVLKAKFDII